MTSALSVSQIHVTYHKREILHNIEFDVQPGEIIVCIGPNGAGKSTLLRAIAGVVPLSRGRVTVFGDAVHTLAPSVRAKRIAVVPQLITMPVGFSVFEVVAMARYVHHAWYDTLSASDTALVWDALTQAGVAAFAHTPAHQLSGGEQQRVAIARAIAQRPQLLILDESTAHLDLHHQHAIVQTMHALAQQGVTIIAAMHDINLAAAAAHRICLLNDGHIVQIGTPHAVLQPALLHAVYRTPLHVIPHDAAAVPFFAIAPPAL